MRSAGDRRQDVREDDLDEEDNETDQAEPDEDGPGDARHLRMHGHETSARAGMLHGGRRLDGWT